LPRLKSQRKLFFNLRSAKKSLAWLSNDEVHAVAKDLGVAVSDVREMEGRLSSYDASFDASPDDDDEQAFVVPASYLEAQDSDPALQLENDNWEADVSTHVSWQQQWKNSMNAVAISCSSDG
jgi:RNA polymerase sigma-32 factor